jgi:hypothetical protein
MIMEVTKGRREGGRTAHLGTKIITIKMLSAYPWCDTRSQNMSFPSHHVL